MTRQRRTLPAHEGFVLMALLITLALVTLAAASAGQRWSDAKQRADEEELLFVGEQYRQAIASYWRLSPAGKRSYPSRLEDLVLDPRFPQPRRHLRKLYPDPVEPDKPWGLVKSGPAILGVYSQAQGRPFRAMHPALLSDPARAPDVAERYADWRFVFNPAAPLGGAQPSAPTHPANPPVAPPARQGLR